MRGWLSSQPRSAFGHLADNTGATGVLQAAFTAPEVSGASDFTVGGAAIVDGVSASSSPSRLTIRVEYNVPLAPAGGAGLNVATTSRLDHGTNNGYATSRLAVALQNMAAYFADVLTEDEEDPVEVPAINITATSLPWGGLFDFESEWSPPHRGHRFGNEADLGVSGLTDAQKRAMATAIMRAHIGTPVTAESPFASAAGSCDVATDCPKGYYCAGGQCAVNHWHLRVPYSMPPP